MEYKRIYIRIDEYTILVARFGEDGYYTELIGEPKVLRPNGKLVWEKATNGYKTELFDEDSIGFDCFTSVEDIFIV